MWPVYCQLVVCKCLAGYIPTDANSLIRYLVSTAHCDNISADERVGGKTGCGQCTVNWWCVNVWPATYPQTQIRLWGTSSLPPTAITSVPTRGWGVKPGPNYIKYVSFYCSVVPLSVDCSNQPFQTQPKSLCN